MIKEHALTSGVVAQSDGQAGELARKLPAAALAAMVAGLSVSGADVARAAEYYTPPQPPTTQAQPQKAQTLDFPTSAAPAVKGGEFQLPEGNQWRYSEFINAVQAGKVERVRFSKDGGQLQVWQYTRIRLPGWVGCVFLCMKLPACGVSVRRTRHRATAWRANEPTPCS